MSKKYCFRSLSLIVLFRFFSCLVFREFVSRLQKANKTVYLITGGFDCLIEPIAEELNIPLDHMFANKLFFQFNGKPLKWVVGNESDSTWCSWSETWAVNSWGCNMDLWLLYRCCVVWMNRFRCYVLAWATIHVACIQKWKRLRFTSAEAILYCTVASIPNHSNIVSRFENQYIEQST